MKSEESIFEMIKEKVKKYLKWYLYPLFYFVVVSIVCAYAWYKNPLSQRTGIKIIFKTIGIIPTIVWVGAITLWIFISIFFIVVLFWSKKSFPGIFTRSGFDRLAKDEKAPKSFKRKIISYFLYGIGCILIFVGITLGIWITRPYITLLLSSSKVEVLERKVTLGQIHGNQIIIPSVLVDAPIIEGVDKSKLSQGVCHISNSLAPGGGGNFIIEGHNLAEFGWWRSQSFFSLLEVVGKGTPIYVFYNGRKYVYKVKEKIYRNINDPKLYDITPGERLTLITCVSTWSPTIYTNRRTVIIAYPEF